MRLKNFSRVSTASTAFQPSQEISDNSNEDKLGTVYKLLPTTQQK